MAVFFLQEYMFRNAYISNNPSLEKPTFITKTTNYNNTLITNGLYLLYSIIDQFGVRKLIVLVIGRLRQVEAEPDGGLRTGLRFVHFSNKQQRGITFATMILQ